MEEKDLPSADLAEQQQEPAQQPEPEPETASAEPEVQTEAAEPEEVAAEIQPGDEFEPVAQSDDDQPVPESFSAEQLLGDQQQPPPVSDSQAAELKAVLEAIVYVLNEPMPAVQIASALDRPLEEVEPILRLLAEETSRPERGIFIREVAGGYQMATKPEHHEVLRNFVKNLKQPLKLSQAALETLAVIAYKQPITMPEILEIRGVQGGGVIKTLLDRKIITTAGRKNVIGKPILYKTTKEFLTQFGLKDLNELPSLKEFEDIRRQSLADEEIGNPAQPNLPEQAAEPEAPEVEQLEGEHPEGERPEGEKEAPQTDNG
ncbi:SMC-Scp complex subunit ScpB [uncultured Paludibaculum sp.]|uniref:SMC-Scp complex subunit ScpB n=1 Tax=uncultured Paludibaculum sp. TaxID=1765020 RepID=UPI002AABF376|nr:SMC-Scp complex subunit ScpB [uncultured Paludibaculum sp.]